METALVLQFALTAGLFSLMPGADWAYAITAGLRSRSIVAPILGLASGYVVVVSVIAMGVGAVVASSPGILTALTVVGASYILWLGVSTLLGVTSGDGTLVAVTGTESADRSGSLRQYLNGMGVSGINPKGLMLLLALLPQFLTEEAGPPVSRSSCSAVSSSSRSSSSTPAWRWPPAPCCARVPG